MFLLKHPLRTERDPGPGIGEDRGRRGAPWPLHGADLTPLSPLFGGVSSPLLSPCPLPSSPPVPSSLSFPILPPSLSPRGGRSPCLVLRESPLGRVTERFPHTERAQSRARDSSAGRSAAPDIHTPPTRPIPLG